jgi:hypothetical protein
MHDFIPYFEAQVQIQEAAVRSYGRTIMFLLSAAVILIAYALLGPPHSLGGEIIKLGAGIFAASMAALPYKEITPRRERITFYQHLIRSLSQLDSRPPEERTMILEMAVAATKVNMAR